LAGSGPDVNILKVTKQRKNIYMKKQLVGVTNDSVHYLTGVYIDDDTIDIPLCGYSFYKFIKNRSIIIWLKYRKLLERSCIIVTQKDNCLEIIFLLYSKMDLVNFLQFVEKKKKDKILFNLDVKIFGDLNCFNSSKHSLRFPHRVIIPGLEQHIVFENLRLKTTVKECQDFIEDIAHDIIEVPILFSYESMLIH